MNKPHSQWGGQSGWTVLLWGFGHAGGQTHSGLDSDTTDGMSEQGTRYSDLRTPFLGWVLSANKHYSPNKYTDPFSDKGQGHISDFLFPLLQKNKNTGHKNKIKSGTGFCKHCCEQLLNDQNYLPIFSSLQIKAVYFVGTCGFIMEQLQQITTPSNKSRADKEHHCFWPQT